MQFRFVHDGPPPEPPTITVWRDSNPIATVSFRANDGSGATNAVIFDIPLSPWRQVRCELPTDALIPVNGMRPRFSVTLETSVEILVRSLIITGVPVADLVLTPTMRLGVEAANVEFCPLFERQRVFRNAVFRWGRVLGDYRSNVAVRADLNRTEALTVRATVSGRLVALLWKWDYGFLEQLPAGERSSLNGWRLIREEGASALGAPAPFGALPLYCLDLPAGIHRIDLGEYWGQYVIVGFEPDQTIRAGPDIPPVTIASAVTRHNIVDPGGAFTLVSAGPVVGFDLYRDGVRVQTMAGSTGRAPSAPGRYVLRIDLGVGERTLPLTVGYGRAATPGWPPGFFPIHFYNGWSYAGEFTPNPALLLDLQTIAMFELGANVAFRNTSHEIADALGIRSILNVKGSTMPIARGDLDATLAEGRFLDVVDALAPLPDAVLGLYVEDEPPASAARGLGVMERAMRRLDPRVHLLYTVQGPKALAFWDDAGSTVRMSRAYPIRKGTRADQVPGIRAELTGFVTAAQTAGQSRPLWMVLQAFGDRGRPGIWDPPTPAQLRLMVNLALARGTKAITYFCFDSSSAGRENLTALAHWPFVPQDGRYAEVRRINGAIRSHQALLSSLSWDGGITPDRDDLDVQLLSTPDGRRLAWITNWDAEHATDSRVSLPGFPEVVRVVLPPGSGEIIDLRSGARITF